MTEADVLRYMRETGKTCSLDPVNVSKHGEAYEFAAPAVGAIIKLSFDESHFVASEKRGLIGPYLKKIGLDINDLSNYHPLTNLTTCPRSLSRLCLINWFRFWRRSVWYLVTNLHIESFILQRLHYAKYMMIW